jgi:hypothetical protein
MLDATRERRQPMKTFWSLSKGAAVGSVVGYKISRKRSAIMVARIILKA